MAGARLLTPTRNPVLDENGLPVANARIYFYQPGTNDLATIYTDQGLTTPSANPVIANGSGVWPSVFADTATSFDFAVRTSSGATIYGLRDLSNLSPAVAIGDGLLTATPFAQSLLDDTSASAARDTLSVPPRADPDFTGQVETVKASAFDNETTAALRLKGATDTSKMLTAGFDETEDFGYLQASKPGDSNKPFWVNPNGGAVGVGQYRKVVTLTAAVTSGSPIVQVDVSVDRPQTYVGAVVTGAGIPPGTTVVSPVDYSPGYIEGSGDPFTTEPMTLSANATASGGAVTLTLTYERDLTVVEEWLTNRPALNGDGARDVLAFWVDATAAQTVPGFLRAYGADFSSEKDFEHGGTEGGYVGGDGFVGRRWRDQNGDPQVYKAFFPFGTNMPMDTAKEVANETTRADATEFGNVWTNVSVVDAEGALARTVDSIGGPGFGDQSFIFNDADKAFGLLTGESPGQNTLNDLPCEVGARVFPYSVANQLGQGLCEVYGTSYRHYRSRLVGIAYGEYHNHLLRPSDDDLSATGTTQATGTLLDLDFNRFTTVDSGGCARLVPAIRGARLTVRNDGANPLLIYPYVVEASCTSVSAEEFLTGFAQFVGKHFNKGQAVTGTGIAGGTTIASIRYDVNARLVVELSADATSSATATRTFGAGDTINGGSGAYTLLPGYEAEFHAFEAGSWRVSARRYAVIQTFRAIKSGDQTGVAGETKVAFAGETFDPYAIWNTTDHRVTPSAGYFRVSAVVRIESGHTSDTAAYVVVKKNGSVYAYGKIESASDGESVSVDTIAYANGTDYFEVFFQGDGGSITLDALGSYIEGHHIG